MKIVIDIPEDVKNRLCFGVTYRQDIQTVVEAIDNGTPLPKGHGRLIDADEIIKKIDEWLRLNVGSNEGMTNEQAKAILTEYLDMDSEVNSEYLEAMRVAIKAIDKISHLIDRPCGACEFHKENGCSKWNCVFEEAEK